ncbi:MAG: hypothetical protein AAF449_16190, partial [Myxococcota bacterium]
KAEREQILQEARSQLTAHLKSRPKDGEAQALLATILGELIAGDSDRGAKFGQKSVKLMNQAVENAPNSPRVAVLRGTWLLFMPAMYGGGLDRAESELDRAITLFEKEPSTAPWPNWGRADAFAWRGQIAVKKGERAKAKAFYERGLAEEPDAMWIRHKLLPKVN